jgi:two-component system, NarL family, response regulator DegU
MNSQELRVLIADDHTLFRKGLVMLLKSFPGVVEVSDVDNGQKALDFLKEKPADIVLLDIDMPVLNGKDTAKKILLRWPDLKIIKVSMNDDLGTISELIEMGVHSYLLKTAKPEEVQIAIQFVVNNDFYYNQIIAKALKSSHLDHSLEEDPINVTKREAEILRLICQELTMKEIGDKLCISEKTIHTHRKNLMKKTSAKNAVGLVKFAIQTKIVSF